MCFFLAREEGRLFLIVDARNSKACVGNSQPRPFFLIQRSVVSHWLSLFTLRITKTTTRWPWR